MYKTKLDNSAMILVSTAKDNIVYSTNGTKMNPLEAFYASLAGCAAVYAKKSCIQLGINPEGIEISCVPKAGTQGALSLSKFITTVSFPERFTSEQKSSILSSVEHCAVKEVVKNGTDITFEVKELV